MRPLFKQITIVGPGLIGGSLGLAIKKKGLARRIVGVSRRTSTLHQARKRGAIDRGTKRLSEGVAGSELIVLATPPASIPKLVREIVRSTQGPLLLTDAASTKAWVTREAERILPRRIQFVGGHPMAGSERTGVKAADRRLYEGSLCILTRTHRTRPEALSAISRLWRAVGAEVVTLTPRQHDAWVAQISHIPHLAAAALTLAPQTPALKLAASGFASTTRLALGDPILWEEICRTNAKEITQGLNRLLKELNAFKKNLRSSRTGTLRRQLAQAQTRRLNL